MNLQVHVWLAITCLVATGCAPSGVPGGTCGTLLTNNQPVDGVRIWVFRNEHDSCDLVGFAVSDSNGNFQMYQDGAQGPLWLVPGDYSITLESDGATMRQWPQPRQAAKACECRKTDSPNRKRNCSK